MNANIKILRGFVKEFNETYSEKEVVYDDSLVGQIKKNSR